MKNMDKKMKRDSVLVGVLVAVVAGGSMAALFGDLMMFLVGLAAGFMATQLRDTYLRALAARIDAGGGVVWDVQVNNVTVGTVSDADYARLRLQVFTDWRSYFGQLANLTWCASKVIDSLFVAVPLALFWSAVALFVFAPEQAVDALHQLQALSAQQLVAGIRSSGWLLSALVLLYVFVNVLLLGARFGFVNMCRERSDERLRWQLSVPTVGRVSLLRLEDGGYLFNDESEYLKPKRR